MRILVVNMTLDPVAGGGTAERTLQLCRHLARAGLDCSLLTTDGGIQTARREALEGVRVTALPVCWRRFYFPRGGMQRVRDEVSRADIVTLMNHWTVINAMAYMMARGSGVPHVVCPSGSLQITGRSTLLKRAYDLLIGRRIVRMASAHVAITSDERQYFAAYGLDPSMVRVIPNGIDPADYATAEGHFLQRVGLEGRSYILFVGRLNRIKGPDLLLNAYLDARGSIPDVHLVFAGPDEGLLGVLRSTARERGALDSVHFLGHISGPDKVDLFRHAELVAIPSRSEAMSIVALEAGVAGRPVLMTDRCGFPECARAGGGLIVAANVDAIRWALPTMLVNRETLGEMGRRLNALTLRDYQWSAVVKSYVELYREVLSASRGRRPGGRRSRGRESDCGLNV
ncbi:MAG: glycosyltransferase [Acidobacteriota bacterium]